MVTSALLPDHEGNNMNNRILRLPDISAKIGYSRATIYRQIADALWTKPVRLGAKTIGWPANEVEILIAARIAGQTDNEIKALVKQLEAKRQQVLSDCLQQ